MNGIVRSGSPQAGGVFGPMPGEQEAESDPSTTFEWEQRYRTLLAINGRMLEIAHGARLTHDCSIARELVEKEIAYLEARGEHFRRRCEHWSSRSNGVW